MCVCWGADQKEEDILQRKKKAGKPVQGCESVRASLASLDFNFVLSTMVLLKPTSRAGVVEWNHEEPRGDPLRISFDLIHIPSILRNSPLTQNSNSHSRGTISHFSLCLPYLGWGGHLADSACMFVKWTGIELIRAGVGIHGNSAPQWLRCDQPRHLGLKAGNEYGKSLRHNKTTICQNIGHVVFKSRAEINQEFIWIH